MCSLRARLPATGDISIILPPVERVWQHAVSDTGYAIVYGVNENERRLVLRTLRVQGPRAR